MTSRITDAQCLFPKKQQLFDHGQLQSIAARLIRQTADYTCVPNSARNRRRLVASIESLLQDVDTLHPLTLKPMLDHRHVTPELARLLTLCKEMRSAIAEGSADHNLKRRVAKIAQNSKLASSAADTPDRTRRDDWAGPVIAKANEIKRNRPQLKSSAIARRIAYDPAINPPGSDQHKSENTIYKLLNKCEIR